MLGSNSSVAEHQPVSHSGSPLAEPLHEVLGDLLTGLVGDELNAHKVPLGLIQRTMHLYLNRCAGLCILPGESLNILVGSRPLADDEGKDRVKLAALELLNRKYGITEEDFISAELSAVPAFNASDIGFDRSLIGAYGHDDRVCA